MNGKDDWLYHQALARQHLEKHDPMRVIKTWWTPRGHICQTRNGEYHEFPHMYKSTPCAEVMPC